MEPDDSFSHTVNMTFVEWKDDVAIVRNLYQERKYRRCAVLCAERLKSAMHPVQKTFLLFYQAVCYENLGHIAHEYSSNKIPLFEQARDAFILASEALPLPFLSESVDLHLTSNQSPDCPIFDILTFYDNSPRENPTIPSMSVVKRKRTFPVSTPRVECSINQTPHGNETPPRNEYSPHLSSNSGSVCTMVRDSTASVRDRKHMARLSRSLSSQHTLADYLVPSPLFSRGLSIEERPENQVLINGKAFVVATLSKPLPPTPINRPLPSLPFNHKPQFVLKGQRLVLLPRRKTALATLISKFERASPFDSPSDKENLQPVPPGSTMSAQRFRRISAIFTEKILATEEAQTEKSNHEVESMTESKHDKILQADNLESPSTALGKTYENQIQLPATPCPISRVTKCHSLESSGVSSSLSCMPTMPPMSPDTHLMLYNDVLSSFRNSIQYHIRNIASKIGSARSTQLAHEEEKRQRFAGMAYPQALLPTSPTKAASHRDSRISPSKDARLRSFWSLQNAEQKEIANATGGNDRMAQQKKERIARLKAGGWKDVRKEAKGWKGSIHYEKMRAMAQKDLVAC